MTLSTDVYLRGEVDPSALRDWCNRIMGVPPTATPSYWRGADAWHLGNRLGQGFCAILDIGHGVGGPIPAESCDECCDPGCTWQHDPSCWAVVNWDTGYAYQDEHGGCTALHLRLILQLGWWLDRQGVPWSWRNEYTGEIHEGTDGLREFVEGGAKAAEWFDNVVRPRIDAEAASAGAVVQW